MSLPRFVTCLVSSIAAVVALDANQGPLTVNHYVRVRSSVPGMAGQIAQIYVRERATAATIKEPAPGRRVVLFVHGVGTPAEVAFDAPIGDYSWMAYLADAGHDVFAMDLTGYGRSSRPTAMNDPCNLTTQQQAAFVPSLLAAPCPPSFPHQLNTIESEWNEVNAVVDYLRALRGVDRVNLVAWSLGAPRSGGFVAKYPEKAESLILLAPAFNRSGSPGPPKLPPDGVPMTTQSRDEFTANWDRQVGCADQYDPAVRDAVWSSMLESDPVGATWGPGVRRAPSTAVWGWNSDVAKRLHVPALLVVGAHDRQVNPDRVRELHVDLGSRQKVFVDLACSSHNAMWERNHTLLFRASAEWISTGTVNGMKEGTLRLGYQAPATGAPAAREFKDVTYANVDGKDLGLDIYMPAGAQSPPLLVWVHGGAWSSGTKAQAPMMFVANGFALSSLDFRQSTEARFPAQVHDIKAAIRFLRAKAATYGYRTDRIAIAGSSSGAHLAALVGVTNGHAELEGTVGGYFKESSSVQAIVSYYGASNLSTILAQSTPFGLNMRRPALERLLGALPDQAKALAALASPVTHLDPSDPPLYLLHGDQDPQMPINQSHELEGAYKKLGLDVSFDVVYGAAHGGDRFLAGDYLTRVVAFLRRTLGSR
jgi:acetyl esterase/lipase